MARKCGVYERWVLWLRNLDKQIVLAQRREIIPANSVVRLPTVVPQFAEIMAADEITVYAATALANCQSNHGQLIPSKIRAAFSDLH